MMTEYQPNIRLDINSVLRALNLSADAPNPHYMPPKTKYDKIRIQAAVAKRQRRKRHRVAERLTRVTRRMTPT